MPASPAARRSAAPRSKRFENVISTNITGVFFTVQAALPHLNDDASIILNGSVISVLGNPGYSAYAAAARPACARWRGSWRRNCRRAAFASTWWRPARSERRSGALRSRRRKPRRPSRSASAHRRRSAGIGEPDHIAKTVLFLASDDAAHVQGQELFVDGGATASPSGAPIYRG